MVRVIPGVEVKVVKEIVPQQLFAAGVVGMIGTSNDGPVGVPRAVTNVRELVDIFGQEGAGFHITLRSKERISEWRISGCRNQSRWCCQRSSIYCS